MLTAEENILLPLSIAGAKPDQEWVDRLIDTVGLHDRLGHRPAELSGGQQQRVAVARAVASRPRSSSPTSRPATSTPRAPRRSWSCCGARSLPVTERTRELGMMRAIGTSRWQVRRLIGPEAIITAQIGGVLGIALGVFLAVLVTRAIDDFALAIPWILLAVLFVAASIAGVVASVLPARRAARLDVRKALAYA